MPQDPDPTPGRRQVLQAIAGSVGAGLAAPPFAKADAAHAHVAREAAAAMAGQPAAPAGFLDAHQLETLASLAEAIVPGSSEAGVAAFVDQVLAADSQEEQRSFLSALGAIQAESLTRFGRPWLALDAAQRTVLLTAASTGPSARARRYWTPGEPVLAPPAERRPQTLRDRFDLVKRRVAEAYYSSEKGMRELGWTGQMAHPEFPGCTHPGGHGSDQ
jgi:hypothetical protein